MADEAKRDEEYRKEFEALAAGQPPTKPDADGEKAKDGESEPEKDDKKSDPAPESAADEAGDSADGEEGGDEAEAGDDPEKGDEPKEDTANLAKALKDTKAWATKVAMEKANLEKEIAKLKETGAGKEKVEAAKDSLGETRKVLDDKIKKVSEDYPELKETLDLLAKLSYEGLSKAEDFKKVSEQEAERLELRQRFETEIEPEIVKVHPDFRKVAFSKEYLAWVETQSPAIKYAAMNSLDPRDISMTLTEFKKANAGGEAEKQRLAEEKRLKGIKENLSTVRGGGSVSKNAGKPGKFEDLDPNDREAAFNFLAAKEAQKAAK